MPLPHIEALHTPRLLLREVQGDDLAELMEVNGDPQVTRWLPYDTWVAPTDATAWLMLMSALGAQGHGRQLVLQQRDSGRVIGTALLFHHEEAAQRAELGYVLGRAHWGRGYMGEALRALCRHAFDELGLRRLEAEVNPANLPSLKLLQRLGFRAEGLLRQRWQAKGQAYDTVMHGLLQGELLDPAPHDADDGPRTEPHA